MHSYIQLAQSFENTLAEKKIFNGKPQNLYEPCQYLLQLGGKRIRPAVCLMAAELFSEAANDNAFWSAAAVEFFHNATLIHDDIMDHSSLRRGQQTVHEKFGVNAGILSGDVMIIYAYKCLQYVSVEYHAQLLKLFSQTAIEVCEGQQLDIDFEQRDDVTVEEYIEMISLKTAVLLACSMKMGALIAKAPENDAQLLYEFGKNIGIAFQLQDDYLDTFGESSVVGKKIGGDIVANKKTYLAIMAETVANDSERAQLCSFQNLPASEKIAQTLALYKTLKIEEMSKNAILTYSQQAMQNLEDIELPKEKKQHFIALTNFLINRAY